MYMLHLNSNNILMYYENIIKQNLINNNIEHVCLCLISKENCFTFQYTCTRCSKFVYSKSTCTCHI